MSTLKKYQLKKKLGIKIRVTNAEIKVIQEELKQEGKSKEQILHELSKFEIAEDPEFNYWYNR